MFSLEVAYQRWKETDGVPEFFLCTGCNRIVCFPVEGLTPRSSSDGLWPLREDARLRVYEQSIECDEADCSTRATTHTTWNYETNETYLPFSQTALLFSLNLSNLTDGVGMTVVVGIVLACEEQPTLKHDENQSH
jgi:hypothetical protein